MPTVSNKQEHLMQAVAHNPEFAHEVGIPQAVAKEFVKEDSIQFMHGIVEGALFEQGRHLARMTHHSDNELSANISTQQNTQFSAGIVFKAKDGKILLLRRGEGGDYPLTWGLPCGHIHEGESAEDGARRETLEETGFKFDGNLTKVFDDGSFTTFLADWNEDQFPVNVNYESLGYQWANPETVSDLHPAMHNVLSVLNCDTELKAAELMAKGVLPSPYKYGNITLFAMRVTGTGMAYRSSIEEFVFRDPSLYLNDEFLSRCNGLPVILEHPDKSILNSEEFSNRVIGTIMLPYISNDDVWGIARIYDDSAIQMMAGEQMSTSPAVVFNSASDNKNLVLDDGSALLVEGKPYLIDHLAVCVQGVWDKGGDPVGVLLTNEGKQMAENAEVKQEVESGDKLDKVLAAVGSLHSRMDSISTRMDSLEMPAPELKTAADEAEEKAKADADEEKAKADAEEAEKAKADAEEKAKEESEAKADEESGKYADAQAKADSVYSAFGDSAPAPMRGETLMAYRKRLANKLKSHSEAYKDVNIHAIADSTVLAVIEKGIYADAQVAARTPSEVPYGVLQEIKTRDQYTGIQTTSFRGKPDSWMRQFKVVPRLATFSNKKDIH